MTSLPVPGPRWGGQGGPFVWWGLGVSHRRREDKAGGRVHPDVRHGIVSPPVPAVLQLDAGHTHRWAACGSGGDPRNALLFGQSACLAGLRSRWPRLSMLAALQLGARASICSLCRLLMVASPHNKAATSPPLPSASARQTFVLCQNILLIKMTIRSAR